MKKFKNIMFYLSVIGMLSSVVLYLYSIHGPYYNTTPLKESFSFASSSAQKFSFKVGRTENYMIEIFLSNKSTKDKIELILGEYVKSGKGALIDVRWEIANKTEIVARGSNKEYGYSHIFSRDYSGIAIGHFAAHRNTKYTLSLLVNSVDPEWDSCMPHVEIELHPAKLEYLLGYKVLGVLIFILSAIIVLIIASFELSKYLASLLKRKMKRVERK